MLDVIKVLADHHIDLRDLRLDRVHAALRQVIDDSTRGPLHESIYAFLFSVIRLGFQPHVYGELIGVGVTDVANE